MKYVSIVIFDQKHGFLFELSNRFDVNDENSVPQWFSQMLFLLIGASAGLAGYLQKQNITKRLWYFVAVLGVLLSLDDVATLHEFALQMIHNTFFLDRDPTFLLNAWWLILPIVLVPAAALAWLGWKYLPRRTILLLIMGAATFAIGKVVMDSIANNTSDLFLERGVVQGIEKVFQYLGSAIVLYANLDYLQTFYEAKIAKSIKQLRS